MSIRTAPEERPRLSVRLRSWLQRHDRITVTIGDWPVSNPTVTVTMMALWRWVVVFTLVPASIGVALLTLGPAQGFEFLIPILVLVNIGVLSVSGPSHHEWTDRLVAPAIAQLAKDLGTEVSPKVWRLGPSQVGDLAANLVRLAAVETTRGLGVNRASDLDHERTVIGLAGPTLLPYLRPRLTAAEHRNEPLGLADAEPPTSHAWPTLPGPDENWKQPRNG